ncbi:MAG: HU family DNA-binding protein [Pseudonocardiaceae bacterium]|jgi:DNA-binding protein HU-beta|nr:HU family DNA-binding protein [Pseudonocardiaceae bacterium]
MNKAELIDALAERLGDKKVAAAAVAGLVDLVVRTVEAGERVTITGFGVFEKRARAARTARNPRTGEEVTVQQTDVPAFRPGTLFRQVVSGTRALPQEGDHAPAVAAVSAAPPKSEASPAATNLPTTSAARRPVTRLTAAAQPTAVHVATAEGTMDEAPKVKAAKDKASKVKASKVKASKAAKGAKASKIDSKAVTKLISKGSDKKGGQKSATKKSAIKK